MTPEERFNENRSLVPYVFLKRFFQYPNLREELFQEGLIGLWGAAVHFDESKGVQFSTFAFVSIFRAMRKYLRFILDGYHCVSIEDVVAIDQDGSKLTYNDILHSSDSIPVESLSCLSAIKALPEEQRSICELIQYGLTQEEVGKALGISQSKVSRQLKKILEEVKK